MNPKMQAVFILPLSPMFKFSYSPLDSDEFAYDSGKKLKIDYRVNLKMEDEYLINEAVKEEKQVAHVEEEDKTEEKEEEEFSFDYTNADVSMVLAEDVFVNGKIRPTFPIITNGYDNGSSLQPLLKNLFIQPPRGPHSKCPEKLVVDASPEKCRKSNSTGFSKLRRFRDLFRRSKSDGNDVFVFLNPPTNGCSKKEAEKVNVKVKKMANSDKDTAKNGVVIKAKAPKGAKVKNMSSANEKYYLMNRAKKDSGKRSSYLPYKLGFLTCVNGMSRNVHPF